jgi:hypothetical protein
VGVDVTVLKNKASSAAAATFAHTFHPCCINLVISVLSILFSTLTSVRAPSTDTLIDRRGDVKPRHGARVRAA